MPRFFHPFVESVLGETIYYRSPYEITIRHSSRRLIIDLGSSRISREFRAMKERLNGAERIIIWTDLGGDPIGLESRIRDVDSRKTGRPTDGKAFRVGAGGSYQD